MRRTTERRRRVKGRAERVSAGFWAGERGWTCCQKRGNMGHWGRGAGVAVKGGGGAAPVAGRLRLGPGGEVEPPKGEGLGAGCRRPGERGCATVRVVRGNRGGPLAGRKICAGGGVGFGKAGGKRDTPYGGEKEVAQLHRGSKRGWESQKRGARRGGTGWHLWHPGGGCATVRVVRGNGGGLLGGRKICAGGGTDFGKAGGKEILPIEKKKRWHSCTGGQKGDRKAKNRVRGEVAQGGTFGTRRGERERMRGEKMERQRSGRAERGRLWG